MFHEMEILRVLPKEDVTEFRLVSRQPSRRTVEVTLNSSCFRVMTDSQEGLKDQTFESFEQLLSALDGADAFGSRLCDLVSQQLAAEMAGSDEQQLR
ncbi:unnamed protein product [Cladocopium goreaui]|uniref:Uncharacterized protein n=1 Tax=Cladocopium goreaui TaxID=2562237 RepID=A0A9P1FFR7_9DINO|nr:unnamed protein product [Cladocopium goreaui]